MNTLRSEKVAGVAGRAFKTALALSQSLALLASCTEAVGQSVGRIAWTFPKPSTDSSQFQASPAIGLDGKVYVSSALTLYALDPRANPPSGNRVVWSGNVSVNTQPDGALSSPAVGPSGTIYIGGANSQGVNALLAFKPSDGTLPPSNGNPPSVWPWAQGDGYFFSTPTVGADGQIYVGTDNGGGVYSVGPDAVQAWTTFSSQNSLPNVDSSLALAQDGTLYALSEFSEQNQPGLPYNGLTAFYSEGANAGTTKWASKFVDGYVFGVLPATDPPQPHFNSSPAIGADGTIYVGGADGLYAVENTHGWIKWKFAPPIGPSDPAYYQSVQSSPAIGTDGTIYFGAGDGKLYAVTDNNTTATEKWVPPFAPTWQNPAPVLSSPAIAADNTVYITMQDPSTLKAVLFAVQNGGSAWSLNLNGAYTSCSPTLSAAGCQPTVYVADHDNLYAIQSSNPSTPLAGLALSPWPMYHHDGQHTGRSSPPQDQDPKNSTLLVWWDSTLGIQTDPCTTVVFRSPYEANTYYIGGIFGKAMGLTFLGHSSQPGGAVTALSIVRAVVDSTPPPSTTTHDVTCSALTDNSQGSPGVYGSNQVVMAIAQTDTLDVYVGGNFVEAGLNSYNENIGCYRAGGAGWDTQIFSAGPQYPNVVNGLSYDHYTKKLTVSGTFTSVDGPLYNYCPQGTSRLTVPGTVYWQTYNGNFDCGYFTP